MRVRLRVCWRGGGRKLGAGAKGTRERATCVCVCQQPQPRLGSDWARAHHRQGRRPIDTSQAVSGQLRSGFLGLKPNLLTRGKRTAEPPSAPVNVLGRLGERPSERAPVNVLQRTHARHL